MAGGRWSGLKEIREFLKVGVWRLRVSRLSTARGFLVRRLQVLVLTLGRFHDDRCQLRASALTFYSLLSVVPLLALAFGIAKGFGFEQRLERQILEAFPDQQEAAVRVVEFAHSLLAETQGGLIAGVGVIVLIWTVIQVLGNIERSLNDIWGVKQGRSLVRKLTEYLSMMLIAPVLFVAAGSMTVLVTSRVETLAADSGAPGALSPLITAVLRVLPYGVIWALFTLLYVTMPNTRVRLRYGLLAGVLAGTAFQVVQWLYIRFQIGVSSYGAIYGSFAALPLFLAWMQASWMIVLLGAELSFAEQNRELYEYATDCAGASHTFRRLAALRVARLCVKRFEANLGPAAEEEIAAALGLPACLVRDTLAELTGAGLLASVCREEDGRAGYQPARAIAALTVLEVLRQLDGRGRGSVPRHEDADWERLERCLADFDRTLQASPANLPLKDV